MANRVSAGIIAAALALACSLSAVSEGTKRVPYRDSGGTLTVCTGHTGTDIRPAGTYTDAECRTLLTKDEQHAMQVVLDGTTGPMNPSELAALTDFTFNVGEGHFRSSTLRKLWNQGNHAAACRELPKWVYAADKSGKQVVLPGLVTRRNKEMALCLSSTAS
jgi:lysozyme